MLLIRLISYEMQIPFFFVTSYSESASLVIVQEKCSVEGKQFCSEVRGAENEIWLRLECLPCPLKGELKN